MTKIFSYSRCPDARISRKWSKVWSKWNLYSFRKEWYFLAGYLPLILNIGAPIGCVDSTLLHPMVTGSFTRKTVHPSRGGDSSPGTHGWLCLPLDIIISGTTKSTGTVHPVLYSSYSAGRTIPRNNGRIVFRANSHEIHPTGHSSNPFENCPLCHFNAMVGQTAI